MSDFPINKITSKANTYFKSSKKDQFDLMFNRMYDANEKSLAKSGILYNGFILDGMANNKLSLTKANPAPNQTVSMPKVVYDPETDQEYVLFLVHFPGRAPYQQPPNPLDFMTNDLGLATVYANLHRRVRMPVDVFFSSPISFRTGVEVINDNGVLTVTSIKNSLYEIKILETDPALKNGAWRNPLLGKGGASTQAGIVIPNDPGNEFKIPGTILPTPPFGITSVLGYRPRPDSSMNRSKGIVGLPQYHYGMDVGLPEGSPVYAVADGKVIAKIPKNGAGGHTLVIECTNLKRVNGTAITVRFGYMHLKDFLVNKNDPVTQGQKIATSGGKKGDPGAGSSTGPHLHFDAYIPSPKSRLDPLWTFDWINNGYYLKYNREVNKWNARLQTIIDNKGVLPVGELLDFYAASEDFKKDAETLITESKNTLLLTEVRREKLQKARNIFGAFVDSSSKLRVVEIDNLIKNL